MSPELPESGSRGGGDFDRYAARYDEALGRGLSLSGEDKEYFAHGRVAWLARRLEREGAHPRSVLDFGCGTGSATPYLLDLPGVDRLVGADRSRGSVDLARSTYPDTRARFVPLDELRPDETFDLAFCNGVFHHIPPAERGAALELVRRSLRPGGWFAFWENNSWNPATRWVMSRIPFDRDAVPISPFRARRLLRGAGFEVVRTDYLFVFPHFLRALRGLETPLSRLPLGAQYEVLCRRH